MDGDEGGDGGVALCELLEDGGGVRARQAYAPDRLAPREVRPPFARQLLQVPDGAVTVDVTGGPVSAR